MTVHFPTLNSIWKDQAGKRFFVVEQITQNSGWWDNVKLREIGTTDHFESKITMPYFIWVGDNATAHDIEQWDKAARKRAERTRIFNEQAAAEAAAVPATIRNPRTVQPEQPERTTRVIRKDMF